MRSLQVAAAEKTNVTKAVKAEEAAGVEEVVKAEKVVKTKHAAVNQSLHVVAVFNISA